MTPNKQSSEAASHADRLDLLRRFLSREKLGGLIVPRSDAFLGHDIRPREERLAWLAGFTGSAGYSIVTLECAAIFTDSRYTDQARQQVDGAAFIVIDVKDAAASQSWIEAKLPDKGPLGYIPFLHSMVDVDHWRSRLAKTGVDLVPVEPDPFDELWTSRPAAHYSTASPYDLRYSGRSSASKRAEIGAAIGAHGAAAAMLCTRESNAWLFNIRGTDLVETPVVDAISILHTDGSADLFLSPSAVTSDLLDHLGGDVSVHDLFELASILPGLVSDHHAILLDPESTNASIHQTLVSAGATDHLGLDPCLLPKARKNAVEIQQSRDVHIVDGVALVRFFCWLEATLAREHVSEVNAQDALLRFRAMAPNFTGLSFPTISAAGMNAAITHYEATPATARLLGDGPLYLVDSGGQYPGATTDVTRTIAVGQPTPAMRQEFTAIVRGHIALAQARFPVGTTGGELDILARQHLWNLGLDYQTSTGHGIGSYLGVHEGPQKIKRGHTVSLEPGMIVSNEPGYCKFGSHGMRVENLMVVCAQADVDQTQFPMRHFETLTMVPIDRSLLDVSKMAAEEIIWIDLYHRDIAARLMTSLNDNEKNWLQLATRPLADLTATAPPRRATRQPLLGAERGGRAD